MFGDKRVHVFPLDIRPNVDVIAWLGFELTSNDVIDQHDCQYATVTPLIRTWMKEIKEIHDGENSIRWLIVKRSK